MKALFKLFRRFDARRIFGFIRRLGGMSRPKVKCYDLRSTCALRVEGDRHRNVDADSRADFYPRPPGRGRPLAIELFTHGSLFLSTPSGWRATFCKNTVADRRFISIHALRVEGDEPNALLIFVFASISIHALRVEGDPFVSAANPLRADFYPRPPGGGRPSGGAPCRSRFRYFYPRPPGGGRHFGLWYNTI